MVEKTNAPSGRCALSGLPESLLLHDAHIVADEHERLGQTAVPNGIPLSKIHHAALDAHLIGGNRLSNRVLSLASFLANLVILLECEGSSIFK
jgi:HNH endonuclease